jgi:hypothetical protein
MNEEFRKTGTNTVTSTKGFTVEVKPAGGVLYRDANVQAEIDSEWVVKPAGIILYKGSFGNKGFSEIGQSQIDDIFSNTARALEHLGHRVEVWSSPSG